MSEVSNCCHYFLSNPCSAFKSVVLQLRRAMPEWSGFCQMAVQEALWLAKPSYLNLNFSFLNRISLLLIQVATQLSSRGWVDPVPHPILREKFLGYSRESNPVLHGWQSDVLTAIPDRWVSAFKIGWNTWLNNWMNSTEIMGGSSGDLR